MEEFVSVNDFCYNGVNEEAGDGDSFCYCPCDIYGTPKLYYADCHYGCAAEALSDILESFNQNDIFNEDEWCAIVGELWQDSSGRGRVFYEKYIVVGDDGHIPNKEYVDGVISYLGGTYDDYVILYNQDGEVHELPCNELVNGVNDKPSKMEIPQKVMELYNKKNSMGSSANNRFPKNMTKAEYYSLIRQENRNMDRKIIRLTEADLHNIVKATVNRILKEDVLGDDWRENQENQEDSVMNNYEPFDTQIQMDKQDHDWGTQGEEEFDPTYYEDPDWERRDVSGFDDRFI